MPPPFVNFTFAALALALAGCGSLPRALRPPPPAAATATAGTATVTQTGAAEVPAAAETTATTATVTLPAATTIAQDPATGALTYTLPAPAVLTAATRNERVTAPQSFTPPAPPTPADLAAGRAALWFRLGLVAGIAAALFGLVRGWDFVAWGGAAVAAGCALAIWLERSTLALPIIGAGIAFALAGVLAWHFHVKKRLPPSAPRDAVAVTET